MLERSRLFVALRQWWIELVLTLVIAIVYASVLGKNGYANTYYAAAARSMASSWRTLFVGGLDPHAFVTVDKPPFALWIQVASTRVFGFHGWSLILPSVLSAATSALLLMVIVRRHWGRVAALLAAVVFAVTPVTVAVARSNNPDAIFVWCAMCAAYATERAIVTARTRWTVLVGVACGCAFLTKLLAIALVMPALALAFVFGSALPARRRVAHLALAALVFVAIPATWAVAIDCSSLGDEVYVGGSSDGTAAGMIFGYNGFGRLVGRAGEYAKVDAEARTVRALAATSPGFTVDFFGGEPGPLRLANNGIGDQVLWFAPLVAFGAIVVLADGARGRRHDDEPRAAHGTATARAPRTRVAIGVLFAMWALVGALVFSFIGGVFHNYYVSLLAPAFAALVAVGAQRARNGSRLARRAFAGCALGTVIWQCQLVSRLGTQGRVVTAIVATAAIVAGAVLVCVVVVRRAPMRRGPVARVASAGALALLIGPSVWTYHGIAAQQSATFPAARPAVLSSAANGSSASSASTAAARTSASHTPLVALSDGLLQYLEEQRTNERWLIAVTSSSDATAPLIGGHPVLVAGGFNGDTAALSVTHLAQLVGNGELRFVRSGIRSGTNRLNDAIGRSCTRVAPTVWGGTTTEIAIFDCAGRADALARAAR